MLALRKLPELSSLKITKLTPPIILPMYSRLSASAFVVNADGRTRFSHCWILSLIDADLVRLVDTGV